MKPPKVAIYARVSTDRQRHESQLSEVREFCTRRGWTEPAEFWDTVSGAKYTKTGLDAVLKLVRSGRLDVLVCYKLDRLGRSLPHLAQIAEELTNNKVALVCTSQGIDTSNDNAAGRLQLGMLMAFAQFERETIRERINAGVKAAQARGVRFGPQIKRGKHMAAIAALVAKGYGGRRIGKELNLSRFIVWKCMEDLKNGTALPGWTPPIPPTDPTAPPTPTPPAEAVKAA
jgi:DNA invertase Pin-like site-specific DNA recombinase